MYFMGETDFNSWKWQLFQSRRAQQRLEFYSWIGVAIITAVVLYVLYRRLGRWQGIKQRMAQARAHFRTQGIPRHIRRDLRQGLIITTAVLAALLAWSIIR